jgi:hypothetical protein
MGAGGIALMMEIVFMYHQSPDVIAIPLTEVIKNRIVPCRAEKYAGCQGSNRAPIKIRQKPSRNPTNNTV